MKTIKKWFWKFIEWESKPVEFDRGYAILLGITFLLSVWK